MAVTAGSRRPRRERALARSASVAPPGRWCGAIIRFSTDPLRQLEVESYGFCSARAQKEFTHEFC
jgi:hypothetical protein